MFPPLIDIVTEHAEEAAFLWCLRGLLASAPHVGLAALEEADLRVDAHLDGVRTAGEAGWEIACGQLGSGDASEVFVAALNALESGVEARVAEIAAAVKSPSDLLRGLSAALAWAPHSLAIERIPGLLELDEPIRSAAISGAASHGIDSAKTLRLALESEIPEYRSSACVAAARLRRADLLGAMVDLLSDADPEVRFHAAVSSLLLGRASSLTELQHLAQQPGAFAEDAGRVAARALDPQTGKAWVGDLARSGALSVRRASVAAAGSVGDPSLVPWLIEALAEPPLARLAAEALAVMTGLDVFAKAVRGAPPAGFVAGPSDDPAESDVALDADEDLPWLDPAQVRSWWEANDSRFRPGTRHLLGEPITVSVLKAVLRMGRQRERAAAALELALTTHVRLFDVKAPSCLQRNLLGAG